MSSLGKLQEELLMSSLCEVTAKCNLQDIPDLLDLHSVKLFDINNPQLKIENCRKRRTASRTRNGRRRVAKSAPAHLMARVLGVRPAPLARTATKRSVSETEREDKAEDGSEDGFGPLLGALLID